MFKVLVSSIEFKEFTDYIIHSNQSSGNICTINQQYPNAKLTIRLLARSEPITGLFQISLVNKDELAALIHLSQGLIID